MANDEPIDLLKIKIEKAKRELPEATLNAISAVDWRTPILGMRQSKGYTFEQLGDLELETELLLCGLVSPEDYPREVEKRMGISRAQSNELVNEMNDLVFKKIREELVKSMERKKIFTEKSTEPARNAFSTPVSNVVATSGWADTGGEKSDSDVLSSAGIEILSPHDSVPAPEKKEISPMQDLPSPQTIEQGKIEIEPPHDKEVHPILAQKLSGPVKNEVVETEHTLDNITKINTSNSVSEKPKIPKEDPYRETPE